MKKRNGITLIALIITIIVLLILAGISIALVVGDNGVLSNAKKSSQETIIGREKETIAVSWNAVFSNQLANGVEITDEIFEQELINNGNDVTVSYDENENFLVHFNDTGHNYTVNKTGKVNDYSGVVPEEVVESTEVIYVTLYTDGTLGFCSTEAKIEGKTVSKNYTIQKEDSYDSPEVVPWYNERNSIIRVNFVDEIIPTSTQRWFYSCTNLVGIDNIHNLNTVNDISMRAMFYNCTSLTTIDVSNFDTRNVTSMYGMFASIDSVPMSLTEIRGLGSFNTSKVTNMRAMFYNCGSLTSIDVSSFDTKNVTTMHCMFADCHNLISVDVGGFNTSNVTDMYGMFADCPNLTNVDVSGFNTSNVTDMYCMFGDCPSLSSLDLSNFNTSNVTTMAFMFYNCISLTSLDVSSFNTSNVTNMQAMFSDCGNLTSLNLSNFNTSNVTKMNNMFWNCINLISLNLNGFNTSNVTDMSYMFGSRDGIEFMALTEIIGLENFNTSKVTTMNHMFYQCGSLTSLDLSSFNTSNVTDMSYMLSYSTNLQTVFAGNEWTTSNVTNSLDMLYGCTSLVGGNGTRFTNSNPRDKTYARIDLSGQPGYFTYKSN